jgi:hypothetical protein
MNAGPDPMLDTFKTSLRLFYGQRSSVKVSRPAGHRRPQRLESALAGLAFGEEPLSRASDIVLQRPGAYALYGPA